MGRIRSISIYRTVVERLLLLLRRRQRRRQDSRTYTHIYRVYMTTRARDIFNPEETGCQSTAACTMEHAVFCLFFFFFFFFSSSFFFFFLILCARVHCVTSVHCASLHEGYRIPGAVPMTACNKPKKKKNSIAYGDCKPRDRCGPLAEKLCVLRPTNTIV